MLSTGSGITGAAVGLSQTDSDAESARQQAASDASSASQQAASDASSANQQAASDSVSQRQQEISDFESGNYCTDKCPRGQRRCYGECVISDNDPDNCGGCGIECAYDEFCQNGRCFNPCTPACEENFKTCLLASDCCSGSCQGGICVGVAETTSIGV